MDPHAPPPSYGTSLLQTLVALAAVSALAWFILRWGSLRLQTTRGRMKVVERLPLDARRALYLVEVDGRTLVIGSAEGAVSLVTEVTTPARTATLPSEEAPS